MPEKHYFELEALKSVYLEDSYVLDIIQSDDAFRMILEVILLEDHPEYHDPREGEQYCYRHAELVFDLIEKINWLERHPFPVVGPSQELDFGNIDNFVWNGNHYDLEGEWGHVRITCTALAFSFLSENYTCDKPEFLSQSELRPVH